MADVPQRVVAGRDGIAEAATLPDFGEQTRARAAAEDRERRGRLVRLVGPVGGRGPGDRDVGLLGIVRDVADPRPTVAGGNGRRIAGVPVAEQRRGPGDEVVPVDPSGDGDDRAGRVDVGGDERPHGGDVERFDLAGDALCRHAPGGGILHLLEGRHHPVGRVVLGAGEVLQDQLPGVFQLVLGQERPAEDVGVDRQRRRQLTGDHGGGKAGMARGDGLRPLHPRPLEFLDDLAARPRAGSAEHHLAGEGSQTATARPVVDGARRRVERDRHRFQPGQFLAEQHDAVVERRREE